MSFVKSIALYETVVDDTRRHLTSYQASLVEKGVTLWPGQSAQEAAVAALRRSLLKKWMPDNAADRAANLAAQELFLSCNDSCASVDPRPTNLLQELIIGEMKSIIYDFWYVNADGTRSLEGHPFDSLDMGRMGPGASNGVAGYDFYTKLFSAKLTCTSPSLKHMFEAYVKRLPLWTEAERLRSSVYGSPVIVDGSRLAFAPKYTEISRTICVEPSLNMFYQLGFGSILQRRLRSYFGIDLSVQQERNRELARIGSMNGQFSTIDLSSASDSVSLPMLRYLLPPAFYTRLMDYRSPVCELPNGTKVPLNMVSTMGNGFTFPLQTMLFSACVKAVYRALDLPFNKADQANPTFGVFGDDIICHVKAFGAVVSTLKLLGFKTNLDKTFSEGYFRESCGGDYFCGHQVRGVYLRSLDSQLAHYTAFNRLNVWSARTGVYLPSSVRLLGRAVPFLPVPEWENDDAGMRLPLSVVHRPQYDENGSFKYYRLSPKPYRMVFTDEGIRLPKKERRHPRIYNPDGALISFLVGSIRRGVVELRSQNGNNYGRRQSVAPCWEMTDMDAAKAGVLTGRWRNACLTNFGW